MRLIAEIRAAQALLPSAHYKRRAEEACSSHCGRSEPEAPSNKQESSIVGNTAPHFKPPKTQFSGPTAAPALQEHLAMSFYPLLWTGGHRRGFVKTLGGVGEGEGAPHDGWRASFRPLVPPPRTTLNCPCNELLSPYTESDAYETPERKTLTSPLHHSCLRSPPPPAPLLCLQIHAGEIGKALKPDAGHLHTDNNMLVYCKNHPDHDEGPSQARSSIVCCHIPGLSHGNRASWEHSQGSRWATVGLSSDSQGSPLSHTASTLLITLYSSHLLLPLRTHTMHGARNDNYLAAALQGPGMQFLTVPSLCLCAEQECGKKRQCLTAILLWPESFRRKDCWKRSVGPTERAEKKSQASEDGWVTVPSFTAIQHSVTVETSSETGNLPNKNNGKAPFTGKSAQFSVPLHTQWKSHSPSLPIPSQPSLFNTPQT
ncbi:unnamed protein product [Leuciscus chuanchicus]